MLSIPDTPTKVLDTISRISLKEKFNDAPFHPKDLAVRDFLDIHPDTSYSKLYEQWGEEFKSVDFRQIPTENFSSTITYYAGPNIPRWHISISDSEKPIFQFGLYPFIEALRQVDYELEQLAEDQRQSIDHIPLIYPRFGYTTSPPPTPVLTPRESLIVRLTPGQYNQLKQTVVEFLESFPN